MSSGVNVAIKVGLGAGGALIKGTDEGLSSVVARAASVALRASLSASAVFSTQRMSSAVIVAIQSGTDIGGAVIKGLDGGIGSVDASSGLAV